MRDRCAGSLMILACMGFICWACTPPAMVIEKPAVRQRVFTIIPFGNELQESLEDVLQRNLEYPYIGISAAVIVPGYQPWIGICGDSHAGTPITTETMFDIGSIVKNFEAALILRLVEEGQLNLDDPVSAYLPAHPRLDGSITIRQLLDHTSGLFNVFEHPDFPWVDPEVDYLREWGWREVLDTFVNEPYGPPGLVQHYSSTNYLILSVVIEQITGESAAAGIERAFLEPMQLESTFISMGAAPGQEYSVAHPWVDLNQDGTLEDLYGIPLTWKVSLTHPVAFATPLDLARWMQSLYHYQTVLRSDSLSQMLTFPQAIADEPDGRRYGLGVVDYSEVVNVAAYGHTGSSLGYSAAALYLPEYGVTVAWLINTGESPVVWSAQFMGDIWWALFEVLYEHLHTPPAQ